MNLPNEKVIVVFDIVLVWFRKFADRFEFSHTFTIKGNS